MTLTYADNAGFFFAGANITDSDTLFRFGVAEFRRPIPTHARHWEDCLGRKK